MRSISLLQSLRRFIRVMHARALRSLTLKFNLFNSNKTRTKGTLPTAVQDTKYQHSKSTWPLNITPWSQWRGPSSSDVGLCPLFYRHGQWSHPGSKDYLDPRPGTFGPLISNFYQWSQALMDGPQARDRINFLRWMDGKLFSKESVNSSRRSCSDVHSQQPIT